MVIREEGRKKTITSKAVTFSTLILMGKKRERRRSALARPTADLSTLTPKKKKNREANHSFTHYRVSLLIIIMAHIKQVCV